MAQAFMTNIAVNHETGSWIKPDTGIMTVFVWGTFGGATIKIQFSPDGEKWFDDPIGELNFTQETIRTQQVSVGIHIRAVLSNAGASTNLNCMVF